MQEQQNSDTSLSGTRAAAMIEERFRNSGKKLILLDYDGTLVPFNCDPARALPDPPLMALLQELACRNDLDLVIISGRDRHFLEAIFHELDIPIFAEHGAFCRLEGKWILMGGADKWKGRVSEMMQDAVAITPGSYIETKEHTLVWHYRKADPDLAILIAGLLANKLSRVCQKYDLTIMKGRKIIEVKPSRYSKGTAVLSYFDPDDYDFILAAGDDVTDEDLFKALPEWAIKVHIGNSSKIATFKIRNSPEFVKFLRSLAS